MNNKKLLISKNPSIIELEKIITQFYNQGVLVKQDLKDLSTILSIMVDELPDNTVFTH